MTALEVIFVTTCIIAFEWYNFICQKQKKAESLEQFHADIVELASRADCGDREDDWVRVMFTAHMSNKKLQKNCWHKHVAHKMHTNTRYDEKKD